jgi:hypothetical protein
MNKLWLTLLLAILSFSLNAQYNSEGADLISRFRPGTMWFYTGLRPATPEKVRKYDRLMFDLTYNTFNGGLKPFKNNWNSIGFNTNLLFEIPIAKANTVSFGIGLTHSLFSVETSGHFFGADSTFSKTLMSPYQTFAEEKRYLIGNSFSVPLEFRFRTKGWKHFKVHIGGRVGYQANLYSKAVNHYDHGKQVFKDHNFADVNRLIYSAHVRIGIRNWAVYGSYNLNSLFKNKESVQLNLFQVGLSVSLF